MHVNLEQAEQVIEAARKEKPDLIVIGRSHKKILEHLYSGSDIIEILRQAWERDEINYDGEVYSFQGLTTDQFNSVTLFEEGQQAAEEEGIARTVGGIFRQGELALPAGLRSGLQRLPHFSYSLRRESVRNPCP